MQPLYFFADRLASAVARVGEALCELDGRGGLRCPGPPAAQRVAREVREVDFLPRVCIRAGPGDVARPLTLEFPDVPLGSVLRGHIGAAGDAGLGMSAPVTLHVKVDGDDLGLAEVPAQAPGWRAFQLDTARFAGRRGTVIFEIASVAVGHPEVCFDAMTLP